MSAAVKRRREKPAPSSRFCRRLSSISRARSATVEMTASDHRLRLQVRDDGIGGAQAGEGSGLSGLGDRVRAVDGRLRVSSPEGGPTVVTVSLPLHA